MMLARTALGFSAGLCVLLLILQRFAHQLPKEQAFLAHSHDHPHRSPVPKLMPPQHFEYNGTVADFQIQFQRFADIVGKRSASAKSIALEVYKDITDRLQNRNLRVVVERVHRIDLVSTPDSGAVAHFVNTNKNHFVFKLILEYFF